MTGDSGSSAHLPATHLVADITFEGARRILDAVIARATEHGCAVSVAVVDVAGGTVALARMTGAPRFSAELAVTKARTAATFGRSTAAMEAVCAERPAFATGFLLHGEWYVGRGGHPVAVDGAVVGGVGVSGDSADHEDAWASEAAAILR